jgi:hypothetical protein
MSDRSRRSLPFAKAFEAWTKSNPDAARELVNAIVTGYRQSHGKSTDPPEPQPEPEQEESTDGNRTDTPQTQCTDETDVTGSR